jgi:FkbM family methyltransferase
MGPAGSNLKISELGQDFFALETNAYRQKGYFVDIGAADGFTASNSFILEKFYNWSGICVDPNPVFMQSLFNSRNCVASNLCVYSETGKIMPFKFYDDDNGFFGWRMRSGLKEHLEKIDDNILKSFNEINVLTISLNDLLLLYHAPLKINYVSLDTEGSEYEILKNFNFKKYDVECFTTEYSNLNQKENLIELFLRNGYFVREKGEHELWATKQPKN